MEIQTNRKMVGMPAGAPPDLADAATFAQGVVQGAVERLADKPQSIQKVALARAVRADQENQRRKPDRARRDALVILEHHSR